MSPDPNPHKNVGFPKITILIISNCYVVVQGVSRFEVDDHKVGLQYLSLKVVILFKLPN